MTKEALIARNCVYAVCCAEKAAAQPCGQGLTSTSIYLTLGNLGPLFAQRFELRTRVRIGTSCFARSGSRDFVDEAMKIRAQRFAAGQVFRAHPSGTAAPQARLKSPTPRDAAAIKQVADASRCRARAPLPRARESAGRRHTTLV